MIQMYLFWYHSHREHFCDVTKTKIEDETDKCGNFMDRVIDGFQLDVKASGFSSMSQADLQKRINVWHADPNSSPDCTFFTCVSTFSYFEKMYAYHVFIMHGALHAMLIHLRILLMSLILLILAY